MNEIKSKIIIVIMAVVFHISSFGGEKVCFVQNREEADKIITVVDSKEMADLIIFLTKEQSQSGDNVWVIVDRNSADIKVFISNEGVGEKIYFSKNLSEKTFSTKTKIYQD